MKIPCSPIPILLHAYPPKNLHYILRSLHLKVLQHINPEPPGIEVALDQLSAARAGLGEEHLEDPPEGRGQRQRDLANVCIHIYICMYMYTIDISISIYIYVCTYRDMNTES